MTEAKLQCNQNHNPQDNEVNFNFQRKSNLSSKRRMQRKRSKQDEVS